MNLLGKLVLAALLGSLAAMFVCLVLGHFVWAGLAFCVLCAAGLSVALWGDRLWPDPQDRLRP